MKSFFAALACCGLGLSLNSPIGLAADWVPIDTNEESKPTTSNQVENSGSTQWFPVRSRPGTSTKTNRQLIWTPVEPLKKSAPSQPNWAGIDAETNAKDPIRWTPVDPSVAQEIENDIDNEKPIKDASVKNVAIKPPVMPSGATFGNSRALWRDDFWHPQISFLIPNGYGPYGVMLEANATGTDCTLGKGPCKPFSNFDDWQSSLETQANGTTYFNGGFGNTQTWGGILVTNSFERAASAIDTGESFVSRDSLLAGVQTGLHYAKAIGPDTSFRTGVENLITWDSKDYTFSDMTRNFYFVGSQRFRLKAPENSNKWFRNLYLTAGIGNGEFKPIEQTFKDQTKALKDAGCQTYGFTPSSPCSQERFKRALRTGSDYGQMNPIGSISLEVVDGLHLISEWSGRNLNAGFSWRPFQDIGFIITPMVESIVQNCEYPGCTVTPIKGYPEKVALPDVVFTERVRLSLQASFQMQF